MSVVLQNMIDAISLGALYALVALGIALILSIMGLINFAHGELIMVGGFVLFYLADQSLIVAIGGTVTAAVLLALVVERVAFRPLRGANATTLLVASFAVSFFLQNVVRLTVGRGRPKSVPLPTLVSEFIVVGDLRLSKLSLITIVSTIGLIIGLWLFLKKTETGTQMRAAAEDFTMALLLGVRANKVIAIAFAISGALAGIVSFLFVAQTAVLTPTMGLSPALFGFVGTVIGGMGSLVGAALGGFLLGVLTTTLQATLPVQLRSARDAFVFTAVIAILLIRPQGLVGTRTRKERV